MPGKVFGGSLGFAAAKVYLKIRHGAVPAPFPVSSLSDLDLAPTVGLRFLP